jgi:predicted AAA+ superfamily ATPase
MISRRLAASVLQRLAEFPAVALLGPRQVGKTTLARGLTGQSLGGTEAAYLDLENPADLEKLEDTAGYLQLHSDRLVIFDEVQRMPGLFANLRGIIDERVLAGEPYGHFLLLGSASIDLLRQSSESLAGRIAYLELGPFDITEVGSERETGLWIRGGFPRSLLAPSEEASATWRANFIATYLERDIPQLGPRIPAETLRRFWTMLAHRQGALLNAAELARSLAVDGKTVTRYLDLMVDLLLVRKLQPLHANVGKRLVKSPKTYLRDSGLVHTLLRLDTFEDVLSHPIVGASWEGHAIETLLRVAPARTEASFYRTSVGAEVDLVLDLPGHRRWAIEVKRGTVPSVSRGFHSALSDLEPARAFVVHSGVDRYPKGEGIEAIGLRALAEELLGSGPNG